jgi:hypothetical protein
MYRVRFNTNLYYSELLFIMYLSFDVYILPLQILNFGVLLTVHLNIFILVIKPLNTELNPICPLLALFGPHHILYVSR